MSAARCRGTNTVVSSYKRALVGSAACRYFSTTLLAASAAGGLDIRTVAEFQHRRRVVSHPCMLLMCSSPQSLLPYTRPRRSKCDAMYKARTHHVLMKKKSTSGHTARMRTAGLPRNLARSQAECYTRNKGGDGIVVAFGCEMAAAPLSFLSHSSDGTSCSGHSSPSWLRAAQALPQ